MTDLLWDIFGGPPAKYDLDAAPIKTYCDECGHETGEEQPHATDCPCLICSHERRNASRAKALFTSAGKTIHFRKITSLRTEAK